MLEFLRQIDVYQQSEEVTDDDLLRSVNHLLVGRARVWFCTHFRQFRTWQAFVNALKREFLPENYNYIQLSAIENRKQVRNESIGTYLTEMQSIFATLADDLPDRQKLYIVLKNLLPCYTLSVAPLGLRTLEELSNVCKRIDEARTLVGKPDTSVSQPFGPYQRRPQVNAIDEESEFTPEEVMAIRRVRETRPANILRPRTCFNCNKAGHIFKDYDQERRGYFCYLCSLRDVTAQNCPRCQGNERAGSQDTLGPNWNSQSPGSQNN